MSHLDFERERNLPAVPDAVDFRTYISSQLIGTKDSSTPTPLGAITFDQNRKILLIGESDGRIVSDTLPFSGIMNPSISGSKRLIELPHLDGVIPTQIDLEHISVRKHRALRGRSTVEARLPFINPITSRSESLVLPEADYLRIFRGENGKIVTFSGGDMSEEVALVLERDFQTAEEMKRYGLVFFIHPNDVDLQLDSVGGFHSFISSANEQFIDLLEPSDLRYMERFDEAVDKKKINLDSEVEIELLRSSLIACIRLGDTKGIAEVEALLKGVGRRGLSRLYPFGGISDEERTKKANKFLDKALGQREADKPKYVSVLGAERAKMYEETLVYTGERKEVWIFNTMMHWIREASEEELTDIMTMISDYDKTVPLFPLDAFYIHQFNEKHHNRVSFGTSHLNGYEYYVAAKVEPRQVKGYFADMIETRRKQLLVQRIPEKYS